MERESFHQFRQRQRMMNSRPVQRQVRRVPVSASMNLPSAAPDPSPKPPQRQKISHVTTPHHQRKPIPPRSHHVSSLPLSIHPQFADGHAAPLKTNHQPEIISAAEDSVVLNILKNKFNRTYVRSKVLEIRSKLRSHTKQQLALMTAGAAIFVFGIGVSISAMKTNAHVEAQTKKGLSTVGVDDENAGDHPDETPQKPGTVNSYYVAPELPQSITIPRIKVNARIIPLGTKASNELKAPSNIYDVGWYNASATLGGTGATLLDGHVHGLTQPGVFYNLKKLQPGDQLSVRRGDGKVFQYKVVKTEVYDRQNVDMRAAVSPVEPGKSGLNIMTCTGSVEKSGDTYNKRLIVFTSLIN